MVIPWHTKELGSLRQPSSEVKLPSPPVFAGAVHQRHNVGPASLLNCHVQQCFKTSPLTLLATSRASRLLQSLSAIADMRKTYVVPVKAAQHGLSSNFAAKRAFGVKCFRYCFDADLSCNADTNQSLTKPTELVYFVLHRVRNATKIQDPSHAAQETKHS